MPAPISSSGDIVVTFKTDRNQAWTGFLAVACCNLTVTIGEFSVYCIAAGAIIFGTLPLVTHTSLRSPTDLFLSSV